MQGAVGIVGLGVVVVGVSQLRHGAVGIGCWVVVGVSQFKHGAVGIIGVVLVVSQLIHGAVGTETVVAGAVGTETVVAGAVVVVVGNDCWPPIPFSQ
jgi:hypothetical protein